MRNIIYTGRIARYYLDLESDFRVLSINPHELWKSVIEFYFQSRGKFEIGKTREELKYGMSPEYYSMAYLWFENVLPKICYPKRVFSNNRVEDDKETFKDELEDFIEDFVDHNLPYSLLNLEQTVGHFIDDTMIDHHRSIYPWSSVLRKYQRIGKESFSLLIECQLCYY